MRLPLPIVVACLAAVPALHGRAAQPQDFASARAAAAALPRLHGLVVSHRGEIALEYYARGHSATRLQNIKSASKSLIAALVGIAIERQLIPGLDTPIVRWFPELRKDADTRKQAITIEDLLTMRSGLASTSGGNYGPWVNSGNWVRYVLNRPMVSDPGTSMEYSTGTSHLLSAILTKATGKSTHQFAVETLAKPIGVTLPRWLRDPQGIYFGGNEMQMTPRQMIAVGELYKNRGRAGDRQVVPAEWVEESCTPRTRSRWDSDREYGYGWWSQGFADHRACFAWGFGGQYIFVFRELDLVVAIASSSTVSDERRGYRRQLFNLLEDHILRPAAAAGAPLAGDLAGARGRRQSSAAGHPLSRFEGWARSAYPLTTVVPPPRPAMTARAMISTSAMAPIAIQTGFVYQAPPSSVSMSISSLPDGGCGGCGGCPC
jgi:CubicO group peptidase (beta-lactamase class C family)